MLSKLDDKDLGRYGLNMGDLLDLFELVKEKVTQIDVNADDGTLRNSGCNQNTTQTTEPTQSRASETLRTFQTSGSSVNQNTLSDDGGASCSHYVDDDFSSRSMNTASSDLRLSGDDTGSEHDSSVVESSDEVFENFASRSEVHKMQNYDRKIFRNHINKYKYFLSNNIEATKPSYLSFIGEVAKCKKLTAKVQSKSATKENVEPSASKRKLDEAGTSSSHKLKKPSFKKIQKNVEKAPIKDEHKAFMDCTTLTPREKAHIKEFLQNKLNSTYSISDMLSAEAKSCKATEAVYLKLQECGVVFETDCKKLVEALMDNLYSQTTNINLVTAGMREGLAVSLVATYPKMAHASLLPDDKPWSWIYDRKHNKGKFANYHAHKQRTSDCPRMRSGGSASTKTKQKPKEAEPIVMFCHINDLKLSKDATYLKMLIPDDRKKEEVEMYMKATFQERRSLATDPRCPVRLLIEAFPKLLDFEGRMIDYEFDMMYPDKGSLLVRNFQDLVPSLLKMVEDNPEKYPPGECMKFNDMALNSLIILSKFLPKPKRVNTDTWEKNMNPLPQLVDFFHMVPVGTDLLGVVSEKRIKDKAPVQPYIIGIGSTQKLERLALVLGDSKLILLPRSTMPLKAVDLLLKANYVLNTHFYLGWKYVMRFLAANLCKIPAENPRHSVFTEQFLQLQMPSDQS